MNAPSTPLSGTVPESAPRPAAAAGRSRRTVDAPTRLVHWLLALCFTGAYLTADSEPWRALHITLGYTMAGLLGWRLVYGLIGPRPVRLASLWRRASGGPAWLRARLTALRQGDMAQAAAWRQGPVLAMGVVLVLMLALIAPLVLSGYGTYQEWGAAWGDGEWLAEVHEFFGNALLAAVGLHLALVVLLSVMRRQNQAMPMLTGRQPGPGPDLVPANRAWLAALLLAGVLGFWAWQWQQYPQGLLPGAATAGATHGALDDDDD